MVGVDKGGGGVEDGGAWVGRWRWKTRDRGPDKMKRVIITASFHNVIETHDSE